LRSLAPRNGVLLVLPLGLQAVLLLLEVGQLLLELAEPLHETPSVSLRSASRSISSCIMRRRTSSSSAGIESISMRSFEAASSTRSMALSGRKRSEM
jgi:hypothetical protein